MPKPRVLAVDDVPSNLLALEALLHREYELIRANSGAEAIAVLRKTCEVDVILMDIQMPGMDGYEAARQIKTLPGCRDIPLIFLTAVYSEDPHVKRGYEAGAIDYFSKPFDPDILKMKLSVYASFRQRAAVLDQREKQLRHSEELLVTARKLSNLLESGRVGVILSDIEGRIFQTNEEVLRLVGSADAAATDAYGEVMRWWNQGGQVLKGGSAALSDAVRRGLPVQNELITVSCLDGSRKTLRASTSPLRGIDRTLVGAVIVLQDVTEHRRTGEELEHKIANLISLGTELQRGLS